MIDLVKPWIAFLKPWEKVKETKGSILEGIIYAEIGALVAVLLLWLFSGTISVTSILLYLAVVLLTPIGLLIFSGICYIIAKLLGGKGDFGLQTFRFSYFSYPTMILYLVIFYLLSKINLLVVLYLLLTGLWSLVIAFFIIKETHQLSGLRAAVVIAICVTVYAILYVILIFLISFALAFFYMSGALNPSRLTPSMCQLPAPFTCSNPTANTGGVVTITLGQGSGENITINAVACIDSSLLNLSTGFPTSDAYWTIITPTTIPSGGTTTLSGIKCYDRNGLQWTGIGRFRGGYLIINYSIGTSPTPYYTMGFIELK
jgi:hypothetical protein